MGIEIRIKIIPKSYDKIVKSQKGGFIMDKTRVDDMGEMLRKSKLLCFFNLARHRFI